MPQPLPWALLGLDEVEYLEAWDIQRRLVAARQSGALPDTLVLLRHPHTYTMGRRASNDHVLLDEAALAQRGIALHWVDRGGDVTYHGPGQIVGYPILDIRQRGLDVHQYLRALEEVLIRTLASYGVVGARDPDYTGVWVKERKIAAIGIKISRGVSSHGFALNVNTDLSYFQDIVPCGITDRQVTSLEQQLGAPQDVGTVLAAVTYAFSEVFGQEYHSITLPELLADPVAT